MRHLLGLMTTAATGCILMIVPLVWFGWIKRDPLDGFRSVLTTTAVPFLASFLLWLHLISFPLKPVALEYLEAAGFDPPPVIPSTINWAFWLYFIPMYGSAFIAGMVGILLTRRFFGRVVRT